MKDRKVLNVVLGSVVLFLALVSTVLSVMLFCKREAMVANSKNLATALQDVSKTLDANSGTQVAAQVTPEALAANAEEATVDTTVSKVKGQVQKVAKQRNDLADALCKIGDVAGADSKAADFKNVTKYKEQTAAVVKKVEKLQQDKVKAEKDAKNAKNAKTIAEEKAKKANKARIEAEGKIAGAEDKAKSAETRAKSAEVRAKNAETRAARANSEVAKMKAEVRKYRKLLNPESKDLDSEVKVMVDGSADVLKLLVGEVTKISKEYGYVIVNLGTKSAYTQKVGKGSVEVKYNLTPSAKLTIVRGDKFIAEIQFDKLGDFESIAPVPVEKIDDIKVGDKVIWKSNK